MMKATPMLLELDTMEQFEAFFKDNDSLDSENRVNVTWMINKAEFMYAKKSNYLITFENKKNFQDKFKGVEKFKH